MALLHGGSPVILQFRVRESYGNSGRLKSTVLSKTFRETEPLNCFFSCVALKPGGANDIHRAKGRRYSESIFLFRMRNFLRRVMKRMMPISSGAITRMPPIKKSERMIVMVSPFHSAIKKIKVDPSGLPVAENRKKWCEGWGRTGFPGAHSVGC